MVVASVGSDVVPLQHLAQLRRRGWPRTAPSHAPPALRHGGGGLGERHGRRTGQRGPVADHEHSPHLQSCKTSGQVLWNRARTTGLRAGSNDHGHLAYPDPPSLSLDQQQRAAGRVERPWPVAT